MNTKNNLTIYQQRTHSRLKTVGQAHEIFTLFWELEYRTKQDVLTQLIIAFPEYNTPEHRHKFGLLWNFVKYDLKIITALQNVIDQLNSK